MTDEDLNLNLDSDPMPPSITVQVGIDSKTNRVALKVGDGKVLLLDVAMALQIAHKINSVSLTLLLDPKYRTKKGRFK